MQPTATVIPGQPDAAPDHKQLPDKDGSIVTNFQEAPQNSMFTQCVAPRLHELFPDGQYAVGMDSGIYWRSTKEPLEGCKAPDWFLVVGVPPMLDGEIRRSYVLWREVVKPLLVIEYVSTDGSAERDTTPYKGKFWVYEQGICATFYVIFDGWRSTLEVYRLVLGRYQAVEANKAGRYPIEPLGIELGLWEGEYRGMDTSWLRAWDAATGNLMPMAEERADVAEGLVDDMSQLLGEETERAKTERKRANEQEALAEAERKRANEQEALAETERKRAEHAEELARTLTEKLRAAGLDPEA